jgi:S1-C subfamily serine protease
LEPAPGDERREGAKASAGSRSAKAGLLVGDVLVSDDGCKVSAAADVIAAVGAHLAGDKFSVTWLRGGRRLGRVLTLVERPAS